MKPKNIVLVRHGESEANVDPKLYATIPDHRIKLTIRGHEQARETGVEFERLLGKSSVQFYVSPYLRSRLTLRGILETFQPVTHRTYEEPRIREQEWGSFATSEIRAAHIEAREKNGAFYYRMPNGESGADVFDRVSTFLESLHRAFEKPNFPENAVIVTHGLTLRLFLTRWFHWSHEQFETLEEPHNCHYVVMRREEGGRYTLLGSLDGFSRMTTFAPPEMPWE